MHDKTIVALFDDHHEAQQTLAEFEQQGVAHDAITRSTRDPQTGLVDGGLVEMLTRRGVPEADANIYAEGVRRGSTLITLRADDEELDRIVSVLERHNMVDIDQRGREYRRDGWDRYDETAGPYMAPDMDAGRSPTGADHASRTGGETVIPVAEEQLEVGKREVDRGRTRIRSHVVERPVEQQVNLRDETVNVERRAVDPARRPADPDAFEEKTVEVTEKGEEPVVGKTARVTEEVVVRKEAGEHTERVGDTVRKTDVEVERDDASGEAVRRSADKR